MSAEFEQVLQAALDGELSAEAQAALNDALRSDPDALEAYCRQMRMEALLAWRMGSATVLAAETGEAPLAEKIVALPAKPRLWRWAGWAAAALVMLGAVFFALAPNSASAAVSRMLAAMQRGDRSYTISVIEGDARMIMNNGRTLTYEGAALHLRGERQFVLVRPIVEGGQRITGSDGTVNWDIIGDGPVKVTSDLTRFRGGLPGEQQDAPFLDLAGHLNGLKHGYDLTLHDMPEEPLHARLTAVRKSRDVRGPQEIDFTFRRDTGVIIDLELHGLPRAKGGPEALRFTLTGESTLPADYFTHTPHHEPGRRVLNESPAPREP